MRNLLLNSRPRAFAALLATTLLAAPVAQACSGHGSVGIGTGGTDNDIYTDGILIGIPPIELGHSHSEAGHSHAEAPAHGEPGHSHDTVTPAHAGEEHGGEEHDHGGEAAHSHKSVEWHVVPAVFGGMDFFTRITNLDASRSPHLLMTNASRRGYRVVQKAAWDLGGGVAAAMHMSGVPGLAFSAGIYPIKGKSTFATRYVRSLAEIPALPQPKLPLNAQELAPWNVGDSVLFASRGGIIFSLGATYYAVSAGVSYVVRGEWQTFVSKIAPDIVSVRTTKSKLQSFGVGTGAIVASLGLNRFGNFDRNFSFRFNLRDPRAAEAYLKMLAGDMRPAQELTQEQSACFLLAGMPGVTILPEGDTRSTSSGVLKSWQLGLPVLVTAAGARGGVHSYSETSGLADGSTVSTNIGISLVESRSQGFLSKHVRNLRNFYGTLQTRTFRNGRKASQHSGQFKWSFEGNATSDERLGGRLAQLARITGLGSHIDLQVPDANLGYVKAEFTANVSHNATHALVAAASSDAAFAQWQRAAARAVEGALDNPNDTADLCGENGVADCRAKAMDRLPKRLAEMRQALVTMHQTEAANPEAFVKAFADFGRVFTKDPVAFRAVIAAANLRGAAIEMSLQVQGEHIPSYTKHIHGDSRILRAAH